MTRASKSTHGRSDSRIFGLILLVGGGIWLLNETGYADISAKTILSIILILLGLGMMFMRPGGNRAALAVSGIVISSLLIFSPSAGVSAETSLGDFTERPRTGEDLADGYSIMAGSLIVDLTELELGEEVARCEISVVFGEVSILVPRDMTIRLEAKAAAGDLSIDGRHVHEGVGFETARVVGPSDEVDLVVVVDVGLGGVEVTHR